MIVIIELLNHEGRRDPRLKERVERLGLFCRSMKITLHAHPNPHFAADVFYVNLPASAKRATYIISAFHTYAAIVGNLYVGVKDGIGD